MRFLARVNPPSTNRGVLYTLLIDWMEFTYSGVVPDLHRAFSFLDYLPCEEGGHPAHGYTVGHEWGPFTVYSGGTVEQGVHVVATGKKVEELRRVSGLTDKQMLSAIRGLPGARFSRLDVAIDMVNAGIDAALIRSHLEAGSWIGKASSSREWVERDVSGRFRPGSTFYIGSASSDCYIRIYDKEQERMRFEEEAARIQWAGISTWWRFEWQMRRKVADRMGDWIESGSDEEVFRVLSGYLDFLEKTSDTNKARWPRASWYEAVVGNLERGSIDLPAKPFSVERTRNWMMGTTAKSWAMLQLAGVDVDVLLLDLLAVGGSKLEEKDIQAALAERKDIQSEGKVVIL